MKAEFINSFITVTTNVIETMTSVSVVAGKPQLKTTRSTSGIVTGVIGLTSDHLAATIVLSFEESTILGIVTAMFGEPITSITPEVCDAVGELTNMICGGAKGQLTRGETKFNMATPTVISGKNLEISQLGKGPTITIPFSIPAGPFTLEVCSAEIKQ